MAKIDLALLDEDVTDQNREGVRFLVLGTPAAEEPAARRRHFRARRRRKIRGETRRGIPEVWATLGMADDSPVTWAGTVEFSAQGNDRSLPGSSTPVTCQEIDLIKLTVPESGEAGARVRERYISFSNVAFDSFPKGAFTEAEIPRLRLTLMLEPDEGAEVYFQHSPIGDGGRSARGQDADLEYIQPEPTDNHDCTRRDRLTYHIPILPGRRLQEAGDGTFRLGPGLKETFVIKVLTFKRHNAESATVVQRLFYHLWGYTHRLLRWDARAKHFLVADGSEVRPNQPTLLLIHGTMSDTATAFSGLLDGNRGTSWLERLGDNESGRYPQILAFDHPTLMEDAQANVHALLDRLPRGFHFKQGVDVISHSRGGLVAKYLMLHAPQIPIRRGALVACANGVGYYTAARLVGRLLSVLRAGAAGSVPVLGTILALAQHSGKFVIERPGSRLMTPGSELLEEVLRDPAATPPPVLLPIAGSYHKSLSAERRLLRRWGERGLNLLLKPILGARHDWVVGTREQCIVPQGCTAPGWGAKPMPPHRIHVARHSDYFHAQLARRRIADFLNSGKAWS